METFATTGMLCKAKSILLEGKLFLNICFVSILVSQHGFAFHLLIPAVLLFQPRGEIILQSWVLKMNPAYLAYTDPIFKLC